MEYQEVLQNARQTILNCKVCPECNGLACGNTMPGPGSKAPGNGANDNWKAWKAIRINMDTFVADSPVDTSCSLFGRVLSLPLLTGPIGSLRQYSKTDVTVDFNDGVIHAAADTGVAACFGDGTAPYVVPGAIASMAKHGGSVIPVLNPLPNEKIASHIDELEKTNALAICVVVDSAGLNHWKNAKPENSPGSKTVTDLRALKAHTAKPFVVKGVLSAKAACQAVEAGADGIIVSNHGGRVLPYAPSTAEVLPEIVDAVKGQTKIIVDGGIRSGADMVKALALGADAVLICRPFAVAWFGGGSEGVRVYIEKLRREFTEAMYMCGARKLSDLSREMIRL